MSFSLSALSTSDSWVCAAKNLEDLSTTDRDGLMFLFGLAAFLSTVSTSSNEDAHPASTRNIETDK